MPDRARQPLSDRVQAVDRALTILELFTADRPAVRVTEVAAQLGVANSTAHRLLKSLQAAGYVTADPETRSYRLGLAALRLGQRALQSIDLARVALPQLHRLARETSESAFVLTVDGDRAVVLHVVRGQHPLQLRLQVGEPWPLHAGASNMVMLAYLPEYRVEAYLSRPLRRYTPRTETDPDRLRRRLQEIRDRGYAYSIGELTDDVGAVAVPILDGDLLLGGLCVAGLARNFPADRAPALAELLRQAAAAIVRELGGTMRSGEVGTA